MGRSGTASRTASRNARSGSIAGPAAPAGRRRTSPPIGRLHVIARRPVDQLEAFRMVGVNVPQLDLAGVQKAEMRGVDVAFERLQPIALALRAIDVSLVGRQYGRFERRQRWRYRALAHIDV